MTTGTTGELLSGSGGEIIAVERGQVVVHEHLHPQPRQYVMIAVVLVVITGIEVAVSYATGLNTNVMIVVLLALALTKFSLVVAWYMHLKTDARILRRFFIMGIVLALFVFMIVTLMLHGLMNSSNVYRG
ncbi:MAG TPA: cytochrome C oxidase subunit IV family protein [Acidimicrobiia bacterium]|jgi:cytochrome c oxidase subunit 4